LRLLFSGPFHLLEDSFCSTVAVWRSQDRLRPIYVLVPTRVLGRHLMRAVASRHGVSFNVQFKTFPDLAETVAAEQLVSSGRLPLPPLAELLIARKALQAVVHTEGSYFAPVREFPRTPRRILATIVDLKKAGVGPGPLESFVRERHSAKLLELAQIYRESERLEEEAGYFDQSDQLAIAARAAAVSPLLEQALCICLYGFSELNRLEERLLAACLSGLQAPTAAAGRQPVDHGGQPGLPVACAFVPADVAGSTTPLLDWLAVNGFSPAEASGPPAGNGDRSLTSAAKAAPGRSGVTARFSHGPRAIAERLFKDEPAPDGGLPNEGAAVQLPEPDSHTGAARTAAEPPLSDCVSLISAPGVAQEIEEAARQILAYVRKTGASFSDAAVFLRHPSKYERAIRDVFGGAGIPYVMYDGQPYADTLTGRLLRLLARIRVGDYPRAEVMEFLGLAPIRPSLLRVRAATSIASSSAAGPSRPEPEEAPVPSPADWDRYSREAGIVEGRGQWERLRALGRHFRWRLNRLREDAEEGKDSATIPLLERDLHSLAVLERVVNTLFKRLHAIPDRGPVGDIVAKLLRTLLTMVSIPADEAPVVRTLATLARQRIADEEIPLGLFVLLMDDMLGERLPSEGLYRTGSISVSSLEGAVGLPFGLVIIPGLVEGSLPPPPRQDPVLLDGERAALNRAYGTRLDLLETQPARERHAFVHALGAARDAVVLSYPRLEAAGQVRVPSHYLLRVLEILRGRSVDYAALESSTDRIPLNHLDLKRAPLTAAGWDLALVVDALRSNAPARLGGLPGFPVIARGLRAESSRWGRRLFTEYDGVLGISVTPPSHLSATRLETYGVCPFRFLGEHVLRIRQVDEPEELETISPLDRGKVIHRILERFITAAREQGLLPLSSAQREVLNSLLERTTADVLDEFEATGAVGYRFMWDVEKRRIVADLRTFLEGELVDRSGFVPRYLEVRFGPPRPGQDTSPGSSARPLMIEVNGRELSFTGQIDRLDVRPDGAARVIDYKSGKGPGGGDRTRDIEESRFQGGAKLQLPIYVLAAEQVLRDGGLPGPTREAQYYYVTGRGKFTRVRFTHAALESRRTDLLTILGTMERGMATGLFPQRPGDKGENCTWCPFPSVCGHGRVRLVERKRGDSQIETLVGMWEIE
jgi:hypothetical protein